MSAVDFKTLKNLTNGYANACEIGELFGLTEEEMQHPNAGAWIVDCIKQVLTVNFTMSKLTLKKSINGSVEKYNPDPFENRANPLLNSTGQPQQE